MPSHDQYEQLHRALTDTFGVDDIAHLLDARFNLPLTLISRPGTVKEVVVSQVLDIAQRAGWVTKLVEAAHHARPDSLSLAELYDAVQPPAATPKPPPVADPPEPTLEVLVGGASIADTQAWYAGGVRAGRWVCRVEDDSPLGTGVLVGPDAVLTCDSVLDDLLAGRDRPHQFRFRFVADVRLGAGAPGPDDEVVGLAADWLIDHAPRRPADITAPPEPDHLGYALVRLARRIGDAPGATGEPRGWAWVPDEPNLPEPGAVVAMLHYPFHDSLRISVGARGLIGPNPDRTQLWYQLNTAAGSSGGPCFDRDWNLLAIHQGKVPAAAPRSELWGQGIVATAIRAQLARRGKTGALGDRPPG